MADRWWLLFPLGFVVGAFGTLIGAGGGFMLVPILLLLMPGEKPATITAISLGVVFFNATSGSVAYLRMGRVDIRSAAWFALATLPGAVIGVLVTRWIPRQAFNLIFGGLLLLAGIYLELRPESGKDPTLEPEEGHTTRNITDTEGIQHVYSFFMHIGLVLSVFVGFISSLLGIGGGIIHVPVLNRTLNFPIHIATATSHVILSFVALVGTLVHLSQGDLAGHYEMLAMLGLGAVVGAQVGARLSNLVQGSGIIRALAIALGVVGIRLLIG